MVSFVPQLDVPAMTVAIMSLLVHEFAHISLVRVFGGGVSGFRISFLGATAWVHGLENLKLWQRYAIYLAGPAVNALFAVGAWAAARFLCGIAETVFLYNIVLCVFNLLPVFPLDGGRLVQLFLGNRIGILRANRLLLKTGPVLGSVLIALGVVQAVLYPWNITLLCAGVYIHRKNKQMPTQLYWECIKALQAKTTRPLPTKKIILPKDTTLKQAVEYLGWDYFAEIQVGAGCYISEKELLESILSSATTNQPAS